MYHILTYEGLFKISKMSKFDVFVQNQYICPIVDRFKQETPNKNVKFTLFT